MLRNSSSISIISRMAEAVSGLECEFSWSWTKKNKSNKALIIFIIIIMRQYGILASETYAK